MLLYTLLPTWRTDYSFFVQTFKEHGTKKKKKKKEGCLFAARRKERRGRMGSVARPDGSNPIYLTFACRGSRSGGLKPGGILCGWQINVGRLQARGSAAQPRRDGYPFVCLSCQGVRASRRRDPAAISKRALARPSIAIIGRQRRKKDLIECLISLPVR